MYAPFVSAEFSPTLPRWHDVVNPSNKRLSFRRALLLAIILSAGLPSSNAQISAPTIADSALSTSDPIGTPPGVATDGANESVNLSNGALTVYIPLLSIPQRGGWSLPFAFVHSSNHMSLELALNTSAGPNPLDNDRFEVGFHYSPAMNSFDNLFQINLPRLQASQEYGGYYTWGSTLDGDYQTTGIFARFCVTNFVFTDWQGSKHPFAATFICSLPVGASAPFVASAVGDATDGSFYRIDFSNASYTQVISRDGTVYKFPPVSNPYGPPPTTSPGSGTATTYNYQDWYDQYFTSMSDSNGNHVSYSSASGTVTDTLNRSFTINGTGITFKDSNGNPQAIALALSNLTPATDPFSIGCVLNQGGPNGNLPAGTSCIPPGSNPNYKYYSNASITYPVADSSGDQRVLSFEFDPEYHITKISYPTGGYTRYVYSSATVQSWNNVATITYPMYEVASKFECPSANGTCSAENETQYAPTLAQITNTAAGPYNSAMTVTDPELNVTVHTFNPITAQQIAPKEASVLKMDSAGHKLWSQSTNYTTAPVLNVATDLQFPSNVTTNWYDSTGTTVGASSSVGYLYDNYSAQIAPQAYQVPGNPPQTTSIKIDNATEIDEYDFGVTTKKRITTQTWNPLGFFSGSNGHILDRLSSKTVADQIQSLSNSTTFVYDNGTNTVGNLTKKSVIATNAPTATTTYVVNSYGQVTSTTDPNGSQTQFGYSDTWANTTCAPPSSSAYLTSVTDPLNETTSYAYNSCTGTIASVTGPNPGQKSSYSYDALQRVVTVAYPDNGGKKACYFDSTPNTVVTYTLQAAGSTLPNCTTTAATALGTVADAVVMDGLGRSIQTTLLSDPDGATSTNTSYDPNGNVESVSIPFRSVANSGYTTSYKYDGLNRKLYAYQSDSTSQSSSSFEEWSYSGNVTTYTDENGNQWKRTIDAMGNLTQVVEPSGSSTSPTLETDYGYDGFNNLWSVKQWGGSVNSVGSRNRSFIYDGMSRLRSAANAESGTTTYVYDANGNLTSKTIPAPNTAAASKLTLTINYGYDSVNRIVSKTYTNDQYQSPWTCFQYGLSANVVAGKNQIGRLMNEWTQRYSTGSCTSLIPSSGFLTARKILEYDSMGRVKQEQQCTPSNCSASPFSLSNTYDLAGDLSSYTNGITSTPGAGAGTLTFTQGFGGAGHLQSVTSSWNDSLHPPSVFSAPSSTATAYAPQGALENAVLGTVLSVSRAYDTRLRLTSETVTGSKVLSATPGTAAITFLGSEQSK